MAITKIAVVYQDHPNPNNARLVPIGSRYRRRWWLPVLGPTPTCLLDLMADYAHLDHHIFDAHDLAVQIGRPKGRTDTKSPLIRTLDRIVTLRFANWDIEPDNDMDPCLTVWRHCPRVPARNTRHWSPSLQHDHNQSWTAHTNPNSG